MINKLKELRAGGEEEGFTLIELMIVVVIIGILAAIAIPVFANQQKSAIEAGIKSDVKNTNTNVATALVKTPTAADVSTIGAVLVQSDENTVAVAGPWDNYTVTGTNATTFSGSIVFNSATGATTNTLGAVAVTP